MATYTVEEFKGLVTMRTKKPVRSLPKHNMGKLIVGFDADTSSSGVAVYDAAADKVVFKDCIELTYIQEFLRDLKNDYKGREILARVEMPTMSTAFGVFNRMRFKMQRNRSGAAKMEKALFNVVWNSARCHQTANYLLEDLERYSIPYELVNSEERTNLKTNRKFKGVDEHSLDAMLYRKTQIQRFDFFPSKVSAKITKHIWGIDKAGNEEIRDALFLALPERQIKRYSRGIK